MPSSMTGEDAIKAFYNVVNRMNKIIEALNSAVDNPTSRFICGCMAALVERAEAVVSLYKVGNQHSADIVIRNISEISIHIQNANKIGQEYIDRLRVTSLKEFKSRYNYALKCGIKLNCNEIEKFKEKIKAIDAKINQIEESNGWPPKSKVGKVYEGGRRAYTITLNEAFHKAGFKEHYLDYMQLCERTHANLYSINQDHLAQFDEFGFVDIGKPLNPLELKFSLSFAAELLIEGIAAAVQHFKIDEKILEPINAAREQMELEFSKMKEA